MQASNMKIPESGKMLPVFSKEACEN